MFSYIRTVAQDGDLGMELELLERKLSRAVLRGESHGDACSIIRLTSRAMLAWCSRNRVELNFSRKGRPTDNAHVESFNGRLRDECLNFHWFMSLSDARVKIDQWRREYNEYRPHYSLGFKTPMEFADEATIEIPEMEIKSESLV